MWLIKKNKRRCPPLLVPAFLRAQPRSLFSTWLLELVPWPCPMPLNRFGWELANCPAVFFHISHCGFVMKYSWQIQRSQWAIQVGWVGQFTSWEWSPSSESCTLYGTHYVQHWFVHRPGGSWELFSCSSSPLWDVHVIVIILLVIKYINLSSSSLSSPQS